MNVYGELKKALFELIASPTTTPTPTGRVYADITTPTAAVPMFYNGSGWVRFLTGQTSATVSQSSGKAVTIDWSAGLIQQVTLTDNAVISFSNPQSGQYHTLIVTQKTYTSATPTRYCYTLNMIDQESRKQPYQPIMPPKSQLENVHTWFYKASIVAAYATIPAYYTATALTGAAGTGNAFSHDGNNYVQGSATSPYSANYKIFDGPAGIMHSGLNAIMTPATLAGTIVGVCYNPDSTQVFLASASTPYAQGYWTDRYGAISAINGGPTLAGAAKCVAMHPLGKFVAFGHATTPFASAFGLTATSYSSLITSPSNLPAAQVNAIAFAPTGDYIAVGSGTTPFIQAWAFDAVGSAWGAIVSNPAVLPTGGPVAALGKGIAWRPQCDFIAMSVGASTGVYIVPFSRSTGVFGTAVENLIVGAQVNAVQFSPCGQYLMVALSAAPYFSVYDFSSLSCTLGSPIAYDTAALAGAVNDIAVHPSGVFAVLALAGSPYIQNQPLPSKAKNYLRINY